METTPRKKFTALQKLKIFEAHKGQCCICGGKIIPGDGFILEHKRALALGGTNEIENLGPAHKSCAADKTSTQDLPKINKSKRAKAAVLGCKDDTRSTIPGRGFSSSGRRSRLLDPSLKIVPRRAMFVEE